MNIMKAYVAGDNEKPAEERLQHASLPRFDLLPTGTLWVLAGWQNMSGRRVSMVVDKPFQYDPKVHWQYTYLFEVSYNAGRPALAGIYERGGQVWQQLDSDRLYELYKKLQNIHAHIEDPYTWALILLLRELFSENRRLHYF